MNTQLEFNQVSVALGGVPVIHELSFALEDGEIGCLLGPSGCGKTTVLRTIAGFEQPTAGSVTIAGREVASLSHSLAAETRRVGMVFQDLALFPHLTVGQNVAFGLKGWSRRDQHSRIEELLELVALADETNRYPHELSGGQQQRVALVRAMAPRPPVLLLDEPFSSQDTERRVQLAREVRELLRHDGITGMLVTHDQYEAFAIADHIGVLRQGRLHQWGKAFELYHQPADRFVAGFIGEGVFVCGSTLHGPQIQTELGIIEGPDRSAFADGTPIDLLVRPDNVQHDPSSATRATVIAKDFRGAEHLYTLRLPGNTRLLCLVPSHYNFAIGQSVGVKLHLDQLKLFPQQIST